MLGLVHVVARASVFPGASAFDAVARAEAGHVGCALCAHDGIRVVVGAAILLPESKRGVRIVHCLAKSPAEIVPYAQARERARESCLREQYERLVEGLAAKAVIALNETAANSLLP